MRTVHLRGKNYSIVFKSEDGVRVAKRGGFEEIQMIRCGILTDGSRFAAAGMAVRSPLDEPNNLKGMKLALTRAMENLSARNPSLLSIEKAKLWNAFHEAAEDHADIARANARLAELRDNEESWQPEPWEVAAEREMAFQASEKERLRIEASQFALKAACIPQPLGAGDVNRIEGIQSVLRGCTNARCRICPHLREELHKLQGVA